MIHALCTNIMTLLKLRKKKQQQQQQQLNEDFENICHLFIDNKRSIQFGEDKTTSILFANKQKAKSIPKFLN